MRTTEQSLFQPAACFSFAHLQLPLWLFGKEYAELSMNARVVYAFLLSRFRLSQMNSRSHPGKWVNEEGALYIIYPRAQIADNLHISLNSACTCMKELAAANLIVEERKGQGRANRIYLVDSTLLHTVPCEKKDADGNQTEPTQTAGETPIDFPNDTLSSAENEKEAQENTHESQDSIFLTSVPQDSKMQNSVSQESQKTESKYNNLSNNPKKYNKKNYNNSSFFPTAFSCVPRASYHGPSTGKKQMKKQGKTELTEICEKSGLELLQNPAYGYTAQNYKLMREAVHYLYFLDSLSLQDARYSREYVRQRMREITIETLDMTLERIRQRPQKIRKIVAYAAKTLFSCILEREAESTLEPAVNGESKASVPSDEFQDALLSEMGESRKLTVSESKLIAYAKENGFSPDTMRELVRETIAKNGSFRVEEARGILREWDRRGSFGGDEPFTKASVCSDWEREWIENVRAYERRQAAGA